MDTSQERTMDGILNVYKEKGFTSHDVVAKLRGILHQKKIGHTGTLDPDAVGVLPVCLGRATRVCGLLTDRSKTYEAVVRLGVVTDTQDMTGTIQEEHPVSVSLDEIRQAAQAFTGEIWQIPPMYSAVKVNGKRLYELARQGIEVERQARKITIYSCEVMDHMPETMEFSMRVHCSKGTYIRTLCHDMGQKLGCGAAMASLVRTSVAPFFLEKAHTLAEIEGIYKDGKIEEILYPVDHVFKKYPAVIVEEKGLRFLKNGNDVAGEFCQCEEVLTEGALVRMYDETQRFYAIYKYRDSRQGFGIHKMFFNEGSAIYTDRKARDRDEDSGTRTI